MKDPTGSPVGLKDPTGKFVVMGLLQFHTGACLVGLKDPPGQFCLNEFTPVSHWSLPGGFLGNFVLVC